MSAYNLVVTVKNAACPGCGKLAERVIQFRYGDTWQHRYSVGDRVRWGGNDTGEPGHSLVVAAGYPEPCSSCEDDSGLYDVHIKDDVIVSVTPSDGTYDYAAQGVDHFVVDQ
jgi:hypothetical protein